MNIVVIAGFLGSGKTSLLLALARCAIESNGCRVAIIENEIGKIGVDGQMIQSEGFAVRELFSGCVCCTLRAEIERFSLTVNAIAYGVDPIRLGVHARQRLAEFCFD